MLFFEISVFASVFAVAFGLAFHVAGGVAVRAKKPRKFSKKKQKVFPENQLTRRASNGGTFLAFLLEFGAASCVVF